MLQKLVIKNVALIDSVEIDFTKGLNVLSGETGAGKSVIIESLNFVLGAKADKTMIRTGTEECFVRAEFNVENNSNVRKVFSELDIEEDSILIISRKFSLDGKGSIKVNGNTVTAGMLKKFTSGLVDVHGQSEHFHLLNESNQLALIDKFGGQEISNQKEVLVKIYNDYKSLNNEFSLLGGSEAERLVRIDVLNYQINEIENVDLKEGEEEELLAIREKLRHQQKICSALSGLKSAMTDEGGALDILSNVSREIASITDYDEEYSKLFDRFNEVFSGIEDLSSTADSLLENFDFLRYSPDEIEERLSAIKAIKKKYGGDFNEINQFLVAAKEEVNKLENFSETAQKLSQEVERHKNLLYSEYVKLHELREKAANTFSKNVIAELKTLGLEKSNFSVDFKNCPCFEECSFNSANGFDQLAFMFSANLGEPVKPLSMVISGGEMSRFMLAIKAQTAKYNEISTFIFDEIDAGISGKIASIVAEKFAVISKDVQIIAITHLPQISAMADNNLLIVKTDNGTNTNSNVLSLDEQSKVSEIIRLAGGDEDSLASKQHAKELIEKAKSFKKTL